MSLKLLLFPPFASPEAAAEHELHKGAWPQPVGRGTKSLQRKGSKNAACKHVPHRGRGQTHKQTSHWPLPALAGLHSYAQAEQRALQIPCGRGTSRTLSEREERQEHGATGGMETACPPTHPLRSALPVPLQPRHRLDISEKQLLVMVISAEEQTWPDYSLNGIKSLFSLC